MTLPQLQAKAREAFEDRYDYLDEEKATRLVFIPSSTNKSKKPTSQEPKRMRKR